MKKIVFIIFIATAILITIIGSLYFFKKVKQSNLIWDAIESVEDSYYKELMHICGEKDISEQRCCIASVYSMIDVDARLSHEEVCKNIGVDELKCLGSYKWCVPIANVTSPDDIEGFDDERLCSIDSDCVQVSCCHATDVINKDFAPDCDNVMCTMSCETVLDCGRGTPICNNDLCEIKALRND